MATQVKVYGPPGQPMSASVSRILTCLIEKDVKYELITVNLKAEPKKLQLLRTQSFGQLPYIEDESISLFGSRTICRYIAEKYAGGGNKYLYGTKPSEKASIDQWLEVETRNFDQPSSELVLSLAFGNPKKSRQEEAQIKQNESKLNKVLDMYERRLGESPYLAGEEFTLADLSHLPNTQFLVSATDRGKLFTLRKNVGRWWAAISGRESWKKVVAMQNSPPPPPPPSA